MKFRLDKDFDLKPNSWALGEKEAENLTPPSSIRPAPFAIIILTKQAHWLQQFFAFIHSAVTKHTVV